MRTIPAIIFLIFFTASLWCAAPAWPMSPAPGPEEAFALALGLDDREGVLKGLETFGPNHRFSDSGGWTPLMFAMSLDTHLLLLDRGADPAIPDDLGYTAAHHVIFADWSVELLPRMFAAGVDVNARSGKDETLLDFAAFWFEGRGAETGERLVLLLAEHGADLDRLDKNGLTPLMRAAARDMPHLARVLLDAGADPCLRSAYGNTALEIARSRKSSRAFAVLVKRACRP